MDEEEDARGFKVVAVLIAASAGVNAIDAVESVLVKNIGQGWNGKGHTIHRGGDGVAG